MKQGILAVKSSKVLEYPKPKTPKPQNPKTPLSKIYNDC